MVEKLLTEKEFIENGWLQEANRIFFHPRGLALSVVVLEDENQNPKISDKTNLTINILDARDDLEGYVFEKEKVNSNDFLNKLEKVAFEYKKHKKARKKLIGSWIQKPNATIIK